MCQLTMLHGRTDVVRTFLPNLTFSNALDGNKDGHGYFVVPTMIWRTIDKGKETVFEEDYIKRLEGFLEGQKQSTIISHVRAASFKFNKLIDIENTHPFQADNIVLMHNGTLTAKDEKFEIEDQIDSFWFVRRLADIVNRKKLTPEHIKKAMEDFTGKFAFLIVDMRQTDKIFVVKGKTADLYYTKVRDGRNKILATIINTDDDNIELSSVPLYWRAIKGSKLVIDKPEELDDESIYIFDMKTSTLTKTDVKIEEENTVSSTTRVNPAQGHQHGLNEWGRPFNGYEDGYLNATSIDEMIDKISNLAWTMRLNYTELNLIHQLLFNIPLIFAEKNHIEPFLDTLEILASEFGKRVGKKLMKWQTIKNSYFHSVPNGSAIDVYSQTNLEFPWFMNSGSGLKNVANRVKSGSFNWKAPS